MSKRYYIVAIMMLMHNITWAMNTGLYIPFNIGTGVYNRVDPGPSATELDPEADSIWNNIKQHSGQIGVNSRLAHRLLESLESKEVFLSAPKLANIGIGYQFSSNVSLECKLYTLAPKNKTIDTFTELKESVKTLLCGEEWQYGFSLSGQYNIPLTSSMRFYGKAGKTLCFYKRHPDSFTFSEFSQSVKTKFKEKSTAAVFREADWFGGAGLYYQWSSRTTFELAWECYPTPFPSVDYLHFIKLGMNLYL